MLPEDFSMPEFRDPDGRVWAWDAATSTYIVLPQDGLEPDRGHSTGGDNDLFSTNQLEHSEQVGSPTTEGYVASVSAWHYEPGQMVTCYSPQGKEFTLQISHVDPDRGWIASDADGNQYEVDETGNVYTHTWSGESHAGTIIGTALSDMGMRPDAPGDMYLPWGESEQNYYRTASEWAPPGQVLCPQCREATTEHACPICGKDLTPEWNSEADKNNEFMGVQPTHDNTTEHHTFPDREPKRNREKTDDSYPSMNLSYHLARKLAYGELGDDDWDNFFAGGGSKVEIGKWLLDRNGQLHFDHGMHALHERIAARDGIRYPQDVAALGSVYNDGSADVQRIFSGANFDQESVQTQLEQAFGPVTLQAPVSEGQQQTKGVAFQPFEITGGQWVISPSQRQPITGAAWIKGVTNGSPNPNTDILVAEHLQPEDVELWQNGVKAIITATGGLTSHAAYLASTEGIPVIVGIGAAYNKIESGNYLKIDPQRQVITVMPGADASMSPDQKQQISDAYINYQMTHGGSYLGENPDWIKITTANLDNCPECSDVMHDQDGEKVCHGCGHKQPIIHAAAVLAPLGEAAIGGLAEGGAAAGAEGSAGLMGGGGISGIGGLMQKALRGNPLQNAYYTDRLMGGGGQGGGQAPNDAVEYNDPSEMQGVISKTAGVWGDIIESIVNMLKQTPEAMTDPRNPLSYADDLVGGMAGLHSNESPYISKKVGFFDLLSADMFGEDEVGMATKNDGQNSDPDQQSSSGDSQKEHGDTPEQLKDIDGEGDAKNDSAPEDDIKNQIGGGDPEKALKALHMNLPLVIEFANSPDPGSENPILVALDQLLESAFPGYKDGHDPLAETTDHPLDNDDDGDDKSEDESGKKPEEGDSNDKQKSDTKEASVWHYAFGEEGYASDSRNPYGQQSQEIAREQEGAYICPNCGYNTNNNEYNCPNCGEELTDRDDPYQDYLRELDEEQAPGHYELYGPDQPTWKDMFPHEGTTKESYGEPLAPGFTPVGPGNGMAATAPAPASAPVCPMCGHTHAPGTACPQGATGAPVTAPTAVGQPATPPQPNTVVTKWHVVSIAEIPEDPRALASDISPGDVIAAYPDGTIVLDDGITTYNPQRAQQFAAEYGWTHDKNVAPLDPMQEGRYGPNDSHSVQASFDDEFGFYMASDEKHKEHEVEHTPEDDNSNSTHGPTDDHGVEEGSPWVDETGSPLVEGADYEMKSSNYAIPDRITVDRILPDKIIYTIHTGDVDYQDEVSKEQLATDGVTFASVGVDGPYDSEDGFQDYTAPVRPGQDATPQVDDLSTPSTVVSGVVNRDAQLDKYVGSFRGDSPDNRSWVLEGNAAGGVDVDPSLMAKFAGKDYSPREQRAFIDESGEARNLDLLQLQGTHYVSDDVEDHFNWL